MKKDLTLGQLFDKQQREFSRALKKIESEYQWN